LEQRARQIKIIDGTQTEMEMEGEEEEDLKRKREQCSYGGSLHRPTITLRRADDPVRGKGGCCTLQAEPGCIEVT